MLNLKINEIKCPQTCPLLSNHEMLCPQYKMISQYKLFIASAHIGGQWEGGAGPGEADDRRPVVQCGPTPPPAQHIHTVQGLQ